MEIAIHLPDNTKKVLFKGNPEEFPFNQLNISRKNNSQVEIEVLKSKVADNKYCKSIYILRNNSDVIYGAEEFKQVLEHMLTNQELIKECFQLQKIDENKYGQVFETCAELFSKLGLYIYDEIKQYATKDNDQGSFLDYNDITNEDAKEYFSPNDQQFGYFELMQLAEEYLLEVTDTNERRCAEDYYKSLENQSDELTNAYEYDELTDEEIEMMYPFIERLDESDLI